MPPRRHVPQRTCIVCRQVLGKRTMFRVVHVAATGLTVDMTGKMPGRGAYVCRSRRCWERVTREPERLLGRALKTTLHHADADGVRRWMQEHADWLDDPATQVEGQTAG